MPDARETCVTNGGTAVAAFVLADKERPKSGKGVLITPKRHVLQQKFKTHQLASLPYNYSLPTKFQYANHDINWLQKLQDHLTLPLQFTTDRRRSVQPAKSTYRDTGTDNPRPPPPLPPPHSGVSVGPARESRRGCGGPPGGSAVAPITATGQGTGGTGRGWRGGTVTGGDESQDGGSSGWWRGRGGEEVDGVTESGGPVAVKKLREARETVRELGEAREAVR